MAESEDRALEATKRLNLPAPTNGGGGGLDAGTAGMRSFLEGETSGVELERRDLLMSDPVKGQETVETRVVRNFYQVMDQVSGLWRTAGKIETGPDESPLKLPVVTDFGEGDQELPEGNEIGISDSEIVSVKFGAYRYASIQPISNTLRNSSVLDFGMLVTETLGKRLVRSYRDRLATGDGVAQPQGVTVGASQGPTTAASDAITDDELVDLVHAVGAEYRDAATSSFVMHDSTWQHARKLKDADGRYLAGDLTNGAELRLLGYPVVIDRAMPEMGDAGNRPVVFGAIHDAYRIRHTAVRIDESEHYRFERDEHSYRVVMGLDAKVIDPLAIVALEMG